MRGKLLELELKIFQETRGVAEYTALWQRRVQTIVQRLQDQAAAAAAPASAAPQWQAQGAHRFADDGGAGGRRHGSLRGGAASHQCAPPGHASPLHDYAPVAPLLCWCVW